MCIHYTIFFYIQYHQSFNIYNNNIIITFMCINYLLLDLKLDCGYLVIEDI